MKLPSVKELLTNLGKNEKQHDPVDMMNWKQSSELVQRNKKSLGAQKDENSKGYFEKPIKDIDASTDDYPTYIDEYNKNIKYEVRSSKHFGKAFVIEQIYDHEQPKLPNLDKQESLHPTFKRKMVESSSNHTDLSASYHTAPFVLERSSTSQNQNSRVYVGEIFHEQSILPHLPYQDIQPGAHSGPAIWQVQTSLEPNRDQLHSIPHQGSRSKKNPQIARTRSRSGCITCRNRRIKCDEGKPVCLHCMRSRKVCLGYL